MREVRYRIRRKGKKRRYEFLNLGGFSDTRDLIHGEVVAFPLVMKDLHLDFSNASSHGKQMVGERVLMQI